MIVLDTHVLVWLDSNSPKLGTNCRAAADDALAGDGLAVSAISFWEVTMLVRKGRLALDVGLDTWRRDLLAGGLRELPVDGRVGILAASLDLHGDPADRLIAATATMNDAVLATADERLLEWQTDLSRLNAAK